MRLALGDKARRRLRVAVLAVMLFGGAAAGGRALLASSTNHGATAAGAGTKRSSSQSSRSAGSAEGAGGVSPAIGSVAGAPGAAPSPSSAGGESAAASAGDSSTQGLGVASPSSNSSSTTGSSSTSAAIVPPVEPVGPDVVRTATINLGVTKGSVGTEMSDIASLAAANGGYVDSSSISGGTSNSVPVSGRVVIRVAAADFTNVMGTLSNLGHLRSEEVSGQDVTGQVAQNAATITVLQQEVNLLQNKLSQATEIATFLQIEGQLAPVQQQLQQLQSQQGVLESSVALATVTVNLSAPGAPVAPAPRRPAERSATRTAWHYATHNALVVIDGIAATAGWLFPFAVLGLLAWLIVTKVVRRRRPGMTTV